MRELSVAALLEPEVRSGTPLDTHGVVGQWGATLASPRV